MDKIENIDDIRSLIALGIEECTTLEYKSGIDTSNNHWKSEMAKDVSAMANANGEPSNDIRLHHPNHCRLECF